MKDQMQVSNCCETSNDCCGGATDCCEGMGCC